MGVSDVQHMVNALIDHMEENQEMATDVDLDFECPECGAKIKTTVGSWAQEKTVRCQRGHSINLRDDKRGARQVKRSLDDLDKALKRFGS